MYICLAHLPPFPSSSIHYPSNPVAQEPLLNLTMPGSKYPSEFYLVSILTHGWHRSCVLLGSSAPVPSTHVLPLGWVWACLAHAAPSSQPLYHMAGWLRILKHHSHFLTFWPPSQLTLASSISQASSWLWLLPSPPGCFFFLYPTCGHCLSDTHFQIPKGVKSVTASLDPLCRSMRTVFPSPRRLSSSHCDSES